MQQAGVGVKERPAGNSLGEMCRAGGVQRDVAFEDANHDLEHEIDVAYRTKYRRYAGRILNSVLTPEARSTTIKLVPRSTGA